MGFYHFYHLINGILQVKNKIRRINLMDVFVIIRAVKIKQCALCLDWLYYYSSCNYLCESKWETFYFGASRFKTPFSH